MTLAQRFTQKVAQRKKAQVSIEFIFLIAAGFVLLMGAAAVIGHESARLSSEKEYGVLKDFADGLVEEFYFASSAGDGYSRGISLPDTLNGIEYTVTNTGNSLTVATQKYDVSYIIPRSAGSIHKGDNTMMNVAGQVCVNSCS